jgi:ribosome-binding protein aMBF1 (putative translation factor)
MNNNDYKTIILTNKRNKDNKKNNTTKKVVNPTNSNNYKKKKLIDDNEIHKIETIGRDLGQKIMKARTSKKWKQKDVSEKMNMQLVEYQKLENGTAHRNGQQLNKLGRILGVKLTGKGV